jgi:hypothetical protein
MVYARRKEYRFSESTYTYTDFRIILPTPMNPFRFSTPPFILFGEFSKIPTALSANTCYMTIGPQ